MTQQKSERIMNLTICLLMSRRFVEKTRIRQVVEGYRDLSDGAFERTFERDKDELRSMGVAVETGSNDVLFPDEVGYRIRRESFELPAIEFTPAETAALGLAASVWESATQAGQATSALAKLRAARAQALASAATYRQIVGDDPGTLKGASPVAKLLPRSLDSAIAMAASEHPAILANEHIVDASAFLVKSAEGGLLPQVTASAGVSRSYREADGLPGVSSSNGYSNSASIGATLTIPIYTGGRVDAQVRQNKESLGQARIEVDVARDQVRQAVTSAWTQYTAAQESVDANRALISAAQLALNGVIEERNVGQRTTLDVLNAQNDVITARINLASAEHDVVVASYGILLGIGHLSVDRLGLQVAKYHPEEHYKAVKDKWGGLRTPDGR